MSVKHGIYHGHGKITCKTAFNVECRWAKFFEKNKLTRRIKKHIKSDGMHSSIAQRVVRKYKQIQLASTRS